MKAIILAAGFGGRMRPLTDNTHKTLLEIAGETIVDRMIGTLKEVGVQEVIVATGYRVEELCSHLERNHADIKFVFVHNERYAETNNIYSLALVLENVDIDDDVILIESDLIFRLKTMRKLVESKYQNVAMVDQYRSGMDGTVVKVEDDLVVEVIPPHLQGKNFNFEDKFKTLNIYKFSNEFLNGNFNKIIRYYAQTIDDNCYYELILGLLIYLQQDGIHAELVDDEGWAEVDDPNDLSTAEFAFDTSTRLGFGAMWNYDVLDFCYIRNMHFPTSAMISEFKNNLDKLMHNYGSHQTILNTKLSYALLCDPKRLILLNGASQIYPILREVLCDRKTLIPTPTFGEYERVFPKADTYTDAVGIDFDELSKRAKSYGVVVFVNPNNPTGTVLQTQNIYNLAKSLPSTVFLVDESFIDFSGQPTIMDLLEAEPINNVFVINSLSKSWGVPGMRLGFVYTCDNEFLAQILDHIPIWNSNSLAEFYVEIFLKHRNSYLESIRRTQQDREDFSRMLAKLDIVDEVFPSGADFLLVKLSGEAKLAELLTRSLIENHNIYIKNISSKMQDGQAYIRLAVRTPEDHRRLVDKMASFA